MGFSLYPKTIDRKVEYGNVASGLYHDMYYYNTYYSHSSLAAYPVGSVYQSAIECNPAELFGGVWEQITGRFILAAKDEPTIYGVNDFGGKTDVTLTADNMPKHAHDIPFFCNKATPPLTANDKGHFNQFNGVYGYGQTAAEACADMGVASTMEMWWAEQTNEAEGHEHSYLSSYKGKGKKFNVLPPYLAINTWKRIA